MSIYSHVDSGAGKFKSRFSKSISNVMNYDCRFHELIPVLKKFVLPGDVWRIGGDALVRFHPMLSPTLTPNYLKVRYFFVPLRLIEPTTEFIITGSVDGNKSDTPIPEFDNFVAKADKEYDADAFKVKKYSFWDYMGIQIGDYEGIKNNECLPAAYWQKAYNRIFWDFYRDENFEFGDNDLTFDRYIEITEKEAADQEVQPSNLSKDYFTSSLPWQLKGAPPTIFMNGSANIDPNFGTVRAGLNQREGYSFYDNLLYGDVISPSGSEPDHVTIAGGDGTGPANTSLIYMDMDQDIYDIDDAEEAEALVKGRISDADKAFKRLFQGVNINSNMGFNTSDLRTMVAQTRIFERLARCGSRYTEYLRSNFFVAPADGTLQRAQYLGGWTLPIVTSEVLQTAADGSTPVGTMRGHGISRGSQRISTFYAKEFGVLFGLAEIRPKVQYTTGIKRELTYKRRFDFFNPSLQHLSEQEVRNGELFISFTDGKNDDTFGFQAYANELRSSVDENVGDLRDGLSFWNQAIHFSSRPNLNLAFLGGDHHLASFNAPFAVNGVDARPIIVSFANILDVYRPMVKYATPGLVDHL